MKKHIFISILLALSFFICSSVQSFAATVQNAPLKIIPFKRIVRPLDRASKYNGSSPNTGSSIQTSGVNSGGLQGISLMQSPLYQQENLLISH